MYKLIVPSLLVFAVMLSMGQIASAHRDSSTPQHGLIISCDTDCWVEIDKKIVGYVQKGRRVSFPVASGNHAVAAATRDGELWEQQSATSNATGQVLVISFKKQRSDRRLLEKDVADLQTRVTQKETELAQIREQNASDGYTPEIAAEERQRIVKAIDVYAGRYGTELGLRDSRNQESQQVSDAAQEQYVQNYLENYGNTTGQAATLGVYGIELLVAHRLKVKAHRHQLAVQAASLRMQYLGDLLQDPASPLRTSLQPDYLTMERDVRRKKSHGDFLTAPGRIEYSDSSGVLRLSCSDVKRAKGEKHLTVEYVLKTVGKKKKIRSLVLTAARKSERAYLLGDVYLACPALTE
jgi:hypothetical protein